MGKFQTQHIEWISLDQQCLIEITTRMTHNDEPYRDGDGKCQYEWAVFKMKQHPPMTKPSYTCVGTSSGIGGPIMSGAGDAANAMEGLRSLSSFVEAWIEACEHEERTQTESENSKMFPVTMWDIMDEYHDELYQDTHLEDLLRDVQFWSDRINNESGDGG